MEALKSIKYDNNGRRVREAEPVEVEDYCYDVKVEENNRSLDSSERGVDSKKHKHRVKSTSGTRKVRRKVPRISQLMFRKKSNTDIQVPQILSKSVGKMDKNRFLSSNNNFRSLTRVKSKDKASARDLEQP